MSEANRKLLNRLRAFTESLESETGEQNFTCKKITLNLQPQPYSAERVKHARGLVKLSQALFADLVGVSVRTVQDWEQGRNTPDKSACRLMDEIIRDPAYWKNRVAESAEVLS